MSTDETLIKKMTRQQLIDAIENLITANEFFASNGERRACIDPPDETEHGNKTEAMSTIVRRLYSGQVLPVSPRVLRLIVAELKKP